MGVPGRPAQKGSRGAAVSSRIDFVITWVDGADESWRRSKSKYRSMGDGDDDYLYRDWDNLRYWFRGVEKYAPWVNRIHFITWGHLPGWLNRRHPGLHIVRHADYLPEEYRPTFNSHAIELNLHRIAGLEEQFVYFNDDAFILDYLQPTDFFHNGLPCDSAILSALVPLVPGDPFFHYLVNNVSIINHHFSKPAVLRSHFGKWFSLKYRKFLLKNIYYAPVGGWSGFLNWHLPTSFLISTFREVWSQEQEILHATSLHKFRTAHDVNQYVFSYWQLASGQFWPRRTSYGSFFILGENDREMFKSLSARKYKMICLNDSLLVTDFDRTKEAIKAHFQQLFPDKSEYEL
jgi:hypothetical protein